MLFRDRGKYLSLVVGLSFATLLIAQQGSIFLGLIKRSTGPLQNIFQADLWVADRNTSYVFDLRPLAQRDLERVRAVPGVAWATPLISTRGNADMPDGTYKSVQVLGIDRSTLIGRPPVVTAGSLDDLRHEGAVFVEESGRRKLGNPKIGDTLKLNDKRAVVVGYCRAKLGFESNVILYTTYDNALRFVPQGRETVPVILVGVKEGLTPEGVGAEIVRRNPDLGAWTHDVLSKRSIFYILNNTGIGINFGITVLLGFIVGLAVVGAIFYQFTLENLRHFAVFKAMGASNRRLAGMVLLQALAAGVIGFGVGVGGAGLFSLLGRKPGAELAPFFPPWLLGASAVAMLVCISLGSLLSLRRVMRLDPAVVFK